MSTPTLVIRFRGWAVMRLATDPDPTDEPDGVSGYTYAYAGEPRLDRVFRLQPTAEFIRPGPGYGEYEQWPWGVRVFDAFMLEQGTKTPLPRLNDLPVDLLDNPYLDNRNWLLTPPGWEPFSVFKLRIGGPNDPLAIQRDAPITDDGKETWQLPLMKLLTQAARGIYLERQTIGAATGIWDAVHLYEERRDWLEAELRRQEAAKGDEDAITALAARFREVSWALNELKKGPKANPDAHKVIGAHYAIETFDFPMTGEATTPAVEPLNRINEQLPWNVSFFFGCFDADLLGAFMQGALIIPLRPPPNPSLKFDSPKRASTRDVSGSSKNRVKNVDRSAASRIF